MEMWVFAHGILAIASLPILFAFQIFSLMGEALPVEEKEEEPAQRDLPLAA